MNKLKATNGSTQLDVDTPQMKEARSQVVEQELSARSWKAYYEKMYYSMEAEKLEPEYAKYKKRMEERLAKEKKDYEEFMAKMKEQMESINIGNDLGEVKLEERKLSETEAEDMAAEKTPVIKM